LWGGADECDGAVEEGGFGGGGEDVGEEDVGYAALFHISNFVEKLGGIVGRTSPKTPTTTTTRLKLCCVVRTTFSPGDRCDQCTCPVSPVNVMLFRCGPGVGGRGRWLQWGGISLPC
jgi:hypothetical protein